MSLDPQTRERIESLLQHHRVVLFMKGQPNAPQCGFSAKAVGILDDVGVAYRHVDVLADPEIREGIKTYGDWPTIPQLYIDGDLVGGSDIIDQMAQSGELYSAFGLPQPDRTPPQIQITPAALQMLRKAIDDAGGEVAVQLAIDPQFRTRLQLAAIVDGAIATRVDGIPIQFDAGSARRAQGVTIDWADDLRGRGLVIDNPNAPPAVQAITPAQADARVRAGTLTIVDVRPADERALASLAVEFQHIDDGIDQLQSLPKTTPLAFLCHHGQRSLQVAEHLRERGFRELYNIDGGIQAWAETVDSALPHY